MMGRDASLHSSSKGPSELPSHLLFELEGLLATALCSDEVEAEETALTGEVPSRCFFGETDDGDRGAAVDEGSGVS